MSEPEWKKDYNERLSHYAALRAQLDEAISELSNTQRRLAFAQAMVFALLAQGHDAIAGARLAQIDLDRGRENVESTKL